MDTLTETEDPDLAIGTVRLHLDAVREPALGLFRTLDAARHETAHIAVAGRGMKHARKASGFTCHRSSIGQRIASRRRWVPVEEALILRGDELRRRRLCLGSCAAPEPSG